MFNSSVTEYDYACRECGRQWKMTSGTGKAIKIGSAVVTGVLGVLAILWGGGSDDA